MPIQVHFRREADSYFDGEGTLPCLDYQRGYKSDGSTTGVRPLETSAGTPSNYLFVWNGSYRDLPPGGIGLRLSCRCERYITTNGTDFTVGVVVGKEPGDDYDNIQEAIDHASNADSRSRKITVRDGTYVEHIDFHGKAVWLRSEHGAEHTTIDGNAV